MQDKNALWFDLLEDGTFEEISRSPGLIFERWQAQDPRPEWIVIDEVQKVPSVLDWTQKLIEEHGIKFALTGSSARKLKRGAANLLAGRAFLNYLYPLTHLELGNEFDLTTALEWGGLPKVWRQKEALERSEFLKTYVRVYLKEEIRQEQIVRRLEPFQRFLEIAAQSNGEIINYAKIARDAGAEPKSVERYFEILEDTLLGFQLFPYHRSVRKQQSQKAKFYFFDLGVKRALERQLDVPLKEQSSLFGRAFEHFIILECIRLNDYLRKDYCFYYLRTKDGAEIDLIVDRPGKGLAFVEIKSSTRVDPTEISKFRRIALATAAENQSGGAHEFFFLCRESQPREVEGVRILPWQQGLKEIFGPTHPKTSKQ